MTEEALIPVPSASRGLKLRPGGDFLTISTNLVDGFSYLLKRPWLLVVTGLAGTSLLASAFWLPQLSDQLSSDASGSARWLLSVSAEYGTLGNFLRALGLFNVLHSTLLQLLLAIIALILCAHLSDLLAAAWRFYQLKLVLNAPVSQAGTPVAIGFSHMIYRWRQALPLMPEHVQNQFQAQLSNHWRPDQVAYRQLATGVPAAPDAMTEPGTLEHEWRILAIRQPLAMYLRPFVFLGLLLALVAVWQIVVAGWEVTPPLLAPGDIFRYYPRNLELQYMVQGEALTPLLVAKVGNAQAQQAIQSPVWLRLGRAETHARPGPPAILVETNQTEATLERAGQLNSTPSLGLIFPTVGSEESIVLHKQAVGLRIVRVAPTTEDNDIAAFLVEVYRGKDLQPERLAMSKAQRKLIQIDKDVTVKLTLLPSMAVIVRYLPGLWLPWLALFCILAGAVGFWLRPAFLLVQIASWPTQRAVVVLQSNLQSEIERLHALLGGDHETHRDAERV